MRSTLPPPMLVPPPPPMRAPPPRTPPPMRSAPQGALGVVTEFWVFFVRFDLQLSLQSLMFDLMLLTVVAATPAPERLVIVAGANAGMARNVTVRSGIINLQDMIFLPGIGSWTGRSRTIAQLRRSKRKSPDEGAGGAVRAQKRQQSSVIFCSIACC